MFLLFTILISFDLKKRIQIAFLLFTITFFLITKIINHSIWKKNSNTISILINPIFFLSYVNFYKIVKLATFIFSKIVPYNNKVTGLTLCIMHISTCPFQEFSKKKNKKGQVQVNLQIPVPCPFRYFPIKSWKGQGTGHLYLVCATPVPCPFSYFSHPACTTRLYFSRFDREILKRTGDRRNLQIPVPCAFH